MPVSKGTTNNPNGRPVGNSMSSLDAKLKEIAYSEMKKTSKSYAEVAAEYVWKLATSSTSFPERKWSITFAFERIEGKALQQIAQTNTDEVTVISLADAGVPETLRVVNA